MIVSASNDKITRVRGLAERKKNRNAAGLYVIEGTKMYVEIPDEDLSETYVSESFLRENEEIIRGRYTVVSDGVFGKLSDTVTPQGIMALAKMKYIAAENIVYGRNRNKSTIMILDRIQDPGNLGTIIRSSEAAGIAGVIMNKGCVDIYNAKTVRATMGSIFRVPFAYVDDLRKFVQFMKNEGITVYGAHLKGNDFRKENISHDSAVMIGNESAGLDDELSKIADRLIKIPMEGKVESLNASIAASVLMFALK